METHAVSIYFRRLHYSLFSIETGKPVLVKTAAHLLMNMAYGNKDRLQAGCIVAGWDPVEGPAVYNITIGGSLLKMDFATGGSGSLFIQGLVDAEIKAAGGGKHNMTLDQARDFVKRAVAHAMARDQGSGGIIRTVVVTPTGNDRDLVQGNQLPFGPTGF